MPIFIKRKVQRALDDEGEPTTTLRHYTDDELLTLIEFDQSRFFEVTESHAEQVLRRQNTYQEVTGELYDTYHARYLAPPTEAAVPSVARVAEEATPASGAAGDEPRPAPAVERDEGNAIASVSAEPAVAADADGGDETGSLAGTEDGQPAGGTVPEGNTVRPARRNRRGRKGGGAA